MHSATPAQPIERTTQHLDEQGIAYEVVEHEQAFGAASEAVASGVPPDDAAKSVLLHDEEGYRLAVILASDRLDLRKLSNLLETKQAKLRLATEEEMRADFPEFELGAIPPFGEMLPAPEIVDRRIAAQPAFKTPEPALSSIVEAMIVRCPPLKIPSPCVPWIVE